MRVRLGLPLLLIALAGCVTGQDEKTASATPTQTCTREYRVGSNIATKECSTPMTEAERQRMLDDLRNQTKPGAVTRTGAGS